MIDFLSSINIDCCVRSPIVNGTTCSTSPIILGSNYICSPIITGSTKVCSPIVIGTTCVTGNITCGTICVTSPVLFSSSCSSSLLHCGACTLGTVCVCSPAIIGSTCSSSPLHCGACILGTTCVCSPVIIGSTCSNSPLHCGACVLATSYVCSPIITGSTKVCSPSIIGTTSVCGLKIYENSTCLGSTYLGLTATATCATCATTAGNSLALCNCIPSCFLGATATATCATCATTAGNSLALCNCIPSCFLGATATATCATTAGNSLCLGGNLANTYAPLASPTFTTQITTPSLIVEDLTDGYIPYQKAADDKLSDSNIYYDGTNVGIGTTAPTFKLEIFGAGQTTAALTDAGARTNMLALNSNGNAGGDGGALVFGNSASITAGSLGWAAIKGLLTDSLGNTVGDLAFSTRNASINTALTERMRIVSTGNVGIGTTQPQAKLELRGSVTSPVLATANAILRVYGGDNDDYDPLLDIGTQGHYDSVEDIIDIPYAAWMQAKDLNNTAYPILLNPVGGNVGIGTTSPDYKTDIYSATATANEYLLRINQANANRALFFGIDSGKATIQAKTSNAVTATDLALNPDGGNVGINKTNPTYTLDVSGTTRSSGDMTATNFVLSSDERIKTNIIPIPITPIDIEYKQFNLISDPSQLRYGVVAQDLQKTNPELIREDKDGMLSVAYIDLLIRELTNLKNENLDFKNRISELERRIK